jgi:hypothetical protein
VSWSSVEEAHLIDRSIVRCTKLNSERRVALLLLLTTMLAVLRAGFIVSGWALIDAFGARR